MEDQELLEVRSKVDPLELALLEKQLRYGF
jgi:hypothetical protein